MLQVVVCGWVPSAMLLVVMHSPLDTLCHTLNRPLGSS